jgi:hypothetical protein
MPKEPCHNCRRRRRRCDRSLPHCQRCHRAEEECLGYGKFFSWVNGVASRGKMTGKSFGKIAKATRKRDCIMAPLEADEQKFNNTSLQLSSYAKPVVFMDQPLTDPFIQDMNQNSRFYLFYCTFTSLSLFGFLSLKRESPGPIPLRVYSSSFV